MGTIRVAAAQCGAGTDVDENLATCLRMIDAAADATAQVVVLPEFMNHCAWYDSPEHAWDVAVTPEGPFVTAVANYAKRHAMWVQLNVSVRLTATRAGDLTSSNLLLGPDGSLVARSDKSVLMGNENRFFVRATHPNPVVDLPFGRVGLYACMEGVITEPARSLAVRGAQVLLNSLNSFASDEAALHIPVRAAENKVFVVAACKIGPLTPLAQLADVARMLNIPAEALHGAGESQIVGPDGTVLAQAPRTGETLAVADIDVSAAVDKRRPDGTDVMAMRRPGCYGPLGVLSDEVDGATGMGPVATDRLAVAVVVPGADVVGDVRCAAEAGARLIVLPELAIDADSAASIARVLPPETHVVSSFRSGDAHVGVVIGSSGVVARQPQIHRSTRHAQWASTLGAALVPIDLDWGRLVVIVGDDLAVPETARLAALLGAHVVAAPITLAEPWEASIGLAERAAENRVCLAAASATPRLGGGGIFWFPKNLTLWAEDRERPFDGTINTPDSVHAPGTPSITHAVVNPAATRNKFVSRGTDLIAGRPWAIAGPLTT